MFNMVVNITSDSENAFLDTEGVILYYFIGQAQSESKKCKEPRNQVPRMVWKSEEGFGLVPRLNVAIWHFEVPFTVQFIEEVSKMK